MGQVSITRNQTTRRPLLTERSIDPLSMQRGLPLQSTSNLTRNQIPLHKRSNVAIISPYNKDTYHLYQSLHKYTHQLHEDSLERKGSALMALVLVDPRDKLSEVARSMDEQLTAKLKLLRQETARKSVRDLRMSKNFSARLIEKLASKSVERYTSNKKSNHFVCGEKTQDWQTDRGRYINVGEYFL